MKRSKKIGWLVALGLLALTALVLMDDTDYSNEADGAIAATDVYQSPYLAIAKGFVDVDGGIINLAAQRDGVIDEVYVEEGDFVEAGHVLATQTTREVELQRNRAHAESQEILAGIAPLEVQLNAAQREIGRYTSLAQHQAAAEQRIDELKDQGELLTAHIAAQKAALETAHARLAEAEYEIELRTIRAPVDGRIVKRLARPGVGLSILNVSVLFWFVPETPRIIRAELEERFVDDIALGMVAQVVPESDESLSYSALVKRKGLFFGPKRPSSYDPEERADVRVVEIVLELEADSPLLLGQRVIVKFGNTPTAEQGIAVVEQAGAIPITKDVMTVSHAAG